MKYTVKVAEATVLITEKRFEASHAARLLVVAACPHLPGGHWWPDVKIVNPNGGSVDFTMPSRKTTTRLYEEALTFARSIGVVPSENYIRNHARKLFDGEFGSGAFDKLPLAEQASIVSELYG